MANKPTSKNVFVLMFVNIYVLISLCMIILGNHILEPRSNETLLDSPTVDRWVKIRAIESSRISKITKKDSKRRNLEHPSNVRKATNTNQERKVVEPAAPANTTTKYNLSNDLEQIDLDLMEQQPIASHTDNTETFASTISNGTDVKETRKKIISPKSTDKEASPIVERNSSDTAKIEKEDVLVGLTKDKPPSGDLNGNDFYRESCGRINIIRSNDTRNEGFPIYYPPPLPPNAIDNTTFRIAAKPTYGEHRCNKHAVMAFAYGYQLPQLIHFMTSLWNTGYDGDLVIGVGTNLTQETRSFLDYHAKNQPGLVVYEIPLLCQRKNSCQVANLLEQTNSTTTNETPVWTPVTGARPFRRVSVVRYEYYWAWTTRYSSESLIFLADARDVYFQRNPMKAILHQHNALPDKNRTLVFFQEALKIGESKANSKWIQKTYSLELKNEMAEKMIICSGTTLGSQPAIEIYNRAMVHEFDKTRCVHCALKHDQCFHNYLIHQKRLVGANNGGISNVVIQAQGEGGIVNTVGLVSRKHDGKSLQELGLVNNKTKEILENDGQTVSSVVHMYDRDKEMKDWVDSEIQKELANHKYEGLRTNH